jgi:LCP family protein required for cell wall assembly
MSDGDNATPGRRRPDPPGDDNPWLTRSARPMPGAAPWERASGSIPVPSAGGHAAEQPGEEPAAGHHSDGVTVAELIAKVSGTRPEEQPRRHVAPPPTPPPALPAYAQSAEDLDLATDVIPGLGQRDSELPVLSATRRPAAALDRIDDVRPAKVESHRGRRTAVVVGRIAAALVAVLALASTGAAWQWQATKNRSMNKVSALDLNSRDIVDPTAQFGDENFLIVGVDSRIGANSDMGAGGTDDAGGSRSDTVMLVNIPASRKRVVAVSFPRDLAITPIQCEPWNPDTGKYGPLYDDQTGTYGPDKVYTETKLNSAYSFGGPKCLVKEIQKLSGLSVNRFMAVDFSGFAKMVDALGGVEVCSTTPLEDYELGTVLANAGRQTLDGHTALQYVRARQVTTETNGDYGRIKRQQLFLSSLLRSMISKEVFFNLSKLNDVVNLFIDDTYVDNVQTKDLVDLGQSIQGVNAGRVTFVTVPTGETDSEGNEPPRTDDVRALFDAIINDDPLPEEKNADNTPVPQTPTSAAPAPISPGGELVDAVTTNPGGITVRVSNSTGEDGLASTAASELQQHGFNVTDPDDYPGPLNSTTVFFSAGNEEAAATVASSFTNPTIERVTGMGDVIRVVLGSDFNAVAPPRPSGSPVQVHVLKGASSEPTHLPEDLTVTNAADTTCE